MAKKSVNGGWSSSRGLRWRNFMIVGVMVMICQLPNIVRGRHEDLEKEWIQQQGEGKKGGDESEYEGGEEYYLYYYEEESNEDPNHGRVENSPNIVELSGYEGTSLPSQGTKNFLDNSHLNKFAEDFLIFEAKNLCNCTTRLETAALLDHAIIITEVRENEKREKQAKKERQEAILEKQRKKEAAMIQAKEEAKKRDKERIESLLLAQSKLKPGHRTITKITDRDMEELPSPTVSSKYAAPPEDDDEIPEFMERPEPSPYLTAKQLKKLQRKYELYLERKQEDLIAEGPIVASDCEDLLCASCKTTVEHYVKSGASVAIEDFCKTKIGALYEPIVTFVCDQIMKDQSAREVLQALKSIESLDKQRQMICVPLGFCSESDFLFNLEVIVSDDRSTKCLFCHILAKEIETRVNLLTKVNQDVALEVVKQSCTLLTLPPELQTECTTVVKGTNIAKLSWNFKIYAETILRKGIRSKQRYPSKICEELKFCEKLIDIQKKPVVDDAPFW